MPCRTIVALVLAGVWIVTMIVLAVLDGLLLVNRTWAQTFTMIGFLSMLVSIVAPLSSTSSSSLFSLISFAISSAGQHGGGSALVDVSKTLGQCLSTCPRFSVCLSVP